MKSQPFSTFGCCSRPDETSCSNPPVRCLVIVFRSDGCIIREIMLKVKFLFPAASHSSSLLKCLSFWLKQYNKPPRSQERSLEFLPHARVVCPKQQKPKGTYKPRHPSIRKRGMKKTPRFFCLPATLSEFGRKHKKANPNHSPSSKGDLGLLFYIQSFFHLYDSLGLPIFPYWLRISRYPSS